MLDNTVCPRCDEPITEKFIREALSKDKIDEIIKARQKKCTFCGFPHPNKDMIMLDCGHYTAKKCLYDVVKPATDHNIFRVECINMECRRPISLALIFELIGKERFEEISLYILSNKKSIEDETLMTCDEKNCGCVFLAKIIDNVYECPGCNNKKRCIFCKKDPHKMGEVCPKSKPPRNFDRERDMIVGKIKDCQECGYPVIRDETASGIVWKKSFCGFEK